MDDEGNFVSQRAQDVVELLIGKTYGEYSKSGHGIHFFTAPAFNHFIPMSGKKDNVFYLDDSSDLQTSERAKLELYYNFKHFFVMTGNLISEHNDIICDTINPFSKSGFKDSSAYQLINTVLNFVGNSTRFHIVSQKTSSDSTTITSVSSLPTLTIPVPSVAAISFIDDPCAAVARFADSSDTLLEFSVDGNFYCYDKKRAIQMLEFASPDSFEYLDWLKIQ